MPCVQAPDTLPEDVWKPEPWAASEATAGKVGVQEVGWRPPPQSSWCPSGAADPTRIAEMRFENSQHPREPCHASMFPKGLLRPIPSNLGLGKRRAASWSWVSSRPVTC